MIESRTMRWTGHAVTWENNIKVDIKVIGCECMGRIYLDQDRDQWRAVVNTVMKLRVP
jgi:hypothetical protein